MEIKQPKDPGLLNDFEKKHIPIVKLPKNIKKNSEIEIKIKLGEIEHTMIPEHYVKWVALYEGDKELAKKNLKPDQPSKISFKIKVDQDKELRCLVGCSIHGVWEKVFWVKVK